jgi:hypothetical protein
MQQIKQIVIYHYNYHLLVHVVDWIIITVMELLIVTWEMIKIYIMKL